jgi:hypothetical protein
MMHERAYKEYLKSYHPKRYKQAVQDGTLQELADGVEEQILNAEQEAILSRMREIPSDHPNRQGEAMMAAAEAREWIYADLMPIPSR